MLRPVLEEASRSDARRQLTVLTVRELLGDLDVSVARRRGEPRRAGALGAHLRARGPDAVAVGRRAAADDRAWRSTTAESSAPTSRGWPTTASRASASASGFAHDAVPEALVEAARRAGLPAHRDPLRDAVHRRHREGVRAAGQRAVRGAAALDRRAGAPAADRALRARPRRDRRGAGDADRRRGAGLRRPRRAAGAAHASAASCPTTRRPRVGAELRERARRGDGARLRPLAARAGAARAGAAGRRRRATTGLPQAWLVAVKDSGGLSEFDRLDPAPGGHGRRAGAAAPPRRRRRPSGGWRATCSPSSSTARSPGSELARRLEPFGLGGRVTALVLRRRRGPAARAAAWRPARPRWRRAARRGRQRAGRHGRHARLRAAARLPGRGALRARPARRWSASSQAGHRAGAAGAGRAVAAGRRAARLPRGALRAGGAHARRPVARRARATATAPRRQRRVATYRDLGSFQLLLSLQDSDALRLFCESLLGPIEIGRGPLRRRADALAGGVHRVQRPVGGGRAAAVLPPPHAALPHPQDRGADGARPRQRPRPHRVLAGPARAASSSATSPQPERHERR